ncbi:uncharacterized protein [Centruroides vittatus]|uniref:uncharacterized protein isoform X2 n=1 Tax=Centruroides vittatus TaxID=120091 RepID=UPI003510CB39
MRLFFVTFLIFHYLFMDSNVESVPTAERKGNENQTVDEEQQLDQLRRRNAVQSENEKLEHDASGRKQKKNSILQPNYSPKDYKLFSSLRFTPVALAEYILKSGDEEGVTLAIEELLKENVLNREEAIAYLQEIKNAMMELKDEAKDPNKFNVIPNTKKNEKIEEPKINLPSTSEAPVIVPNTSVFTKDKEKPKKKPNLKPKEFHNEDTLQHVIYQLAKDMFRYRDQSAKESLSELITFLEMEVENKQISPFVKKKILDIISSALIDSLKEYPELLSQEKNMIYSMKPNKENLFNPAKKQQIAISSRNEEKKKLP